MNHPSRSLGLFGLVGTLALTITAALPAKDPEPAVKKTFEQLMKAVEANDRAAFVANATDAVKEGVTEKVMDVLSKHLGTRLKAGYEAAYLCELNQQGAKVYLWKLTFKEKGDDVVIRVALKESKVDGFFLQ